MEQMFVYMQLMKKNIINTIILFNTFFGVMIILDSHPWNLLLILLEQVAVIWLN